MCVYGGMLQEFRNFMWYGKCGIEEYPKDDNNKLDDSYPPPPVLGKQVGLMGGVEGKGPGRISGEKSSLIVVPKNLKGMRSSECQILNLERI